MVNSEPNQPPEPSGPPPTTIQKKKSSSRKKNRPKSSRSKSSRSKSSNPKVKSNAQRLTTSAALAAKRKSLPNRQNKIRRPHPALKLLHQHTQYRKRNPGFRIFPKAGLVWMPSKSEGYTLGKVLRSFERGHHGRLLIVDQHRGAQIVSVSGKKSKKLIPADFSGDSSALTRNKNGKKSNKSTLQDMREPDLLQHIRLQYQAGKRVVRVGRVLVLLNTFQDAAMDLALDESMSTIAREAIDRLYSTNKPQSCIFTGETSSGKSTFARFFLGLVVQANDDLRNGIGAIAEEPEEISNDTGGGTKGKSVAVVNLGLQQGGRGLTSLSSATSAVGLLQQGHQRTDSRKGSQKQKPLLQRKKSDPAATSDSNLPTEPGESETLILGALGATNYVLQVLCSARTSQSAHSTRCAMHTELFFKYQCIVGMRTDLSMFEKSRVVFQRPGENNFDVFYALLASSATDPGMAQALKFTETKPSAYHYLNQGKNAEAVKRHKVKQETRLTRCVMPGCDLDPMDGKTQCYVHFAAYGQRGVEPASSSNAAGNRKSESVSESGDEGAGKKDKRRSSSWFGDAGGASADEYLSTWTRFLECLQQLGFTDRELSDVARMLAAVLHIGNVTLLATEPQPSQGGKGDVAAIQEGCEASAKAASELLGLSSGLLAESLLYRNVQAGMEQLRVPLTRAQAVDVRDTLAKGVYDKLVSWVVERMNAHTCPPRKWADWQRVLAKKGTGSKAQARWQKYWAKVDTLSAFSVFGIEAFEKDNGLEQCVVNFSNEAMQQLFRQFVINQEKLRMMNCGAPLAYQNNTSIYPLTVESKLTRGNGCFGLIGTGRGLGLFEILDEETKTVNGSTSRFLKRTLTNFQRDPEQARLLRKPMANKRQSMRLRSGDVGKEEELTSFTVVHYPGTVNYSVVKFLDTNKTGMHFSMTAGLKKSRRLTLRAVFADNDGLDSAAAPDTSATPSGDGQMWRQLDRVLKKGSAVKSGRARRLSFLVKNKLAFSSSSSLLIGKTVPESEDEGSKSDGGNKLNGGNQGGLRRVKSWHGSMTQGVGGQLKKELRLVQEKLTATDTTYVKCIKINNIAKRDVFDTFSVLTQIKSSGLSEMGEIVRHGYTISFTHDNFVHRFAALAPSANRMLAGLLDAIRRKLKLGDSHWDVDVASAAAAKARTQNASKSMASVKSRTSLVRLPAPQMTGLLKAESTIVMQRSVMFELEIARSIALLDISTFLQKYIRRFLARQVVKRRLHRRITIKLEMAVVDCNLEQLIMWLQAAERWGLQTSVSNEARKHLNRLLEEKRVKEWLVQSATDRNQKELYKAISRAQELGMERHRGYRQLDLAFAVSDELYNEKQEEAKFLLEEYQSDYSSVLNELDETLRLMRALNIVGDKGNTMKAWQKTQDGTSKNVQVNAKGNVVGTPDVQAGDRPNQKDISKLRPQVASTLQASWGTKTDGPAMTSAVTREFLESFYALVGATEKLRNPGELDKVLKHFEGRHRDLLEVLEAKYRVRFNADGTITRREDNVNLLAELQLNEQEAVPAPEPLTKAEKAAREEKRRRAERDNFLADLVAAKGIEGGVAATGLGGLEQWPSDGEESQSSSEEEDSDNDDSATDGGSSTPFVKPSTRKAMSPFGLRKMAGASPAKKGIAGLRPMPVGTPRARGKGGRGGSAKAKKVEEDEDDEEDSSMYRNRFTFVDTDENLEKMFG